MFKNVSKEYVFDRQKSFECCHASSLTVLPNGDILAAWFGGSKEGADDVAIWYSRRVRGSWSSPEILADEEGIPHWNPVLLTNADGRVYLFYKVGHNISEWCTKIKISEDNGFTWTDAAELVPGDRGGRGPVRNKAIVLSDGTWLAPASTEHGIWGAFADRSMDEGKTWIKSNDIYIRGLDYENIHGVKSNIPVSEQSFKGRGVIQPTLWESEPGKVHMLLRSTEGKIYRSDSCDYGKNWTEAYPTVLPNNNSGIDVVKLKDRTLLLVYNPVGINWGPRTPVQLSVSHDNGRTWECELTLENEEGEYSYPAIVADQDTIYITYTWKRERIAFWKINNTL